MSNEINPNQTNDKKPFMEYVNGVEVGSGVYDFVLDFNLASTSNSNKKIGTIIMSPEHAKVFSHIMQDNIRQYEEIFGTIPTPPTKKRVQELEKEGKVVKGDM